MHIVRINNREYKGPDSWEKLSCAGLLHYAQVMLCKTLSDKQAKHQITMRLLGIPYKLFRAIPESGKIQLHTCIDWIFEKNALSAWLIRQLLVGNNKLYGPKDRLADLTGEEFIYCEGAYERWLHDENTIHRDTLFAILYRKRGILSGKRVDFKADQIKMAIKSAQKVKSYVKQSVIINYAGCRNYMIDCHPHIWKKAVAAGETDGAAHFTGWASIFMDLAGDKFGTYPETINTNVWLLLTDLEKKAKHAEESERNNR